MMKTDSEKLDEIYQWMLTQIAPVKPRLLFEVYSSDAPKLMTYLEAEKWAKSIGDGWRIPTLEELRLMYEHKNEIGGFVTKLSGSDYAHWYWSCTEGRDVPSVVWDVRFSDGLEDWNDKDYFRLSTRPVRSVNHSTI